MGAAFWIRRFLLVATIATGLLFTIYLARGRGLERAGLEAAVWGVASALAFTMTRLFWSRRGYACAMCRDMPEE
jgi:hypothetical protein